MSGAPADVVKRSNQRCWRRRARASAKVAAGLGYQAARRGLLDVIGRPDGDSLRDVLNDARACAHGRRLRSRLDRLRRVVGW
jgi:hypothetical protein